MYLLGIILYFLHIFNVNWNINIEITYNTSTFIPDPKLTEIKKMLRDMNEYDIAELIEDLPENLLVQAFRLLPILPTVIHTDKRSKDWMLNRYIGDRLYR